MLRYNNITAGLQSIHKKIARYYSSIAASKPESHSAEYHNGFQMLVVESYELNNLYSATIKLVVLTILNQLHIHILSRM